MNNYIKLFKNHGKAIGTWSGHTTNCGCVVIEHSKTLEGMVSERRYQAEPKNVGRSNETAAVEQAKLELDSRVKKQLDKGYVRTLTEARVPVTNSLGLPLPMLATPLDKVKPESISWEDTFVQPKLDGHRCLYKDGVLYSRKGKELDIPHIHEAINKAGLQDFHLDGELYIHGKTLQELSSLIKKHRPESIHLEYHIYDTVVDLPFSERITALADAVRGRFKPEALQMVETILVTDMEETFEHHYKYRNLGYEGSMLRFGDDPYLTGKRARSLLKLKEFEDAEFTIIGYGEGKPYITDNGTFRVPVWVCDAGNGQTFNVTAQGDMHEKNQQWIDRDSHLLRDLTVKYHYLSKEGIPQLPIALRFREDI